MRSLSIAEKPEKIRTLLFLGAHCDDIEIGCGSTVLKLVEEYPDAHYHWIVLSSNPAREKEARNSAGNFLQKVPDKTISVCDFRNGYFPYIGAEIKNYFEKLKNKIDPDLIFTHYSGDYHQDHRLTAELTWNTFRNHFILEYEIPKYDGGLGSPNVFVPASELNCNRKIEQLLRFFSSESNKSWFSDETFRGLMRLRGIESNSTSGFAEAFYSRKSILFGMD